MYTSATSQRGFTLLELSVVLVLIGIILGMGLVTLTGSLQASQYNATASRMNVIEKALLNYAIANNRIPCPSDLTQTVSSATYGFEAGAGTGSAIATATGVCTGTGMTPQANFVASGGQAEGGVPTRVLQLPDEYMYDGWGRRFRYAVDPSQTKAARFPAAVYSPCAVSSTGITVNDASGAARTTAAVYALISHGANGHGAYTSNGVLFNAGSVNADELTNCHCTSAGVYSGTYMPTYVEKVPMQDAANALDNFDDIVTFKEGWQMQAPNYPLSQTVAQCIYVVDYANQRVEIFNSSGNYISQFGSGGSANGQFAYPYGPAIDPSGNVWLADMENNRVQKFDSTGHYLSQLGCPTGGCYTGTAGGQFYYPDGVAIDPSGNIWVMDSYNYRVQKFDKNGNFLTQIGCASGSCSPGGTGNGQFSNFAGIATDPGGDVYVSDLYEVIPYISRVQKFDSNGNYLFTIGGVAGGDNSHFNYAESLATDASGNLYVADDYNTRVQKYNSSGAYQSTFGTYCAAYGGSGCFYDIWGPAIDSSGNLYVYDANDGVIVKFDSSGNYLLKFGSPGSGNGQIGQTPYYVGLAIGGR